MVEIPLSDADLTHLPTDSNPNPAKQDLADSMGKTQIESNHNMLVNTFQRTLDRSNDENLSGMSVNQYLKEPGLRMFEKNLYSKDGKLIHCYILFEADSSGNITRSSLDVKIIKDRKRQNEYLEVMYPYLLDGSVETDDPHKIKIDPKNFYQAIQCFEKRLRTLDQYTVKK